MASFHIDDTWGYKVTYQATPMGPIPIVVFISPKKLNKGDTFDYDSNTYTKIKTIKAYVYAKYYLWENPDPPYNREDRLTSTLGHGSLPSGYNERSFVNLTTSGNIKIDVLGTYIGGTNAGNISFRIYDKNLSKTYLDYGPLGLADWSSRPSTNPNDWYSLPLLTAVANPDGTYVKFSAKNRYGDDAGNLIFFGSSSAGFSGYMNNQGDALEKMVPGSPQPIDAPPPFSYISIDDENWYIEASIIFAGNGNKWSYAVGEFISDSGTSDDPDKKDDPKKPDYGSTGGSSTSDHISLPDGDFDYHSDNIDLPGAPDDNPNKNGIMGLWAPTRGQMKEILNYLWGTSFWGTAGKIFGNNNPLECVLSCKIYPFAINSEATATMALGSVDTKLTVNIAPSNYFAIFYTGRVEAPTGTWADYAPYSKVSIYLPFIGIKDLDMNAVVGHAIKVQYLIDIVSGFGVCNIKVGKKVMYAYPVQMGKDIPISATDYQRSAQSWAMLGATAVGVSLGVAMPAMVTGTTLLGTTFKAGEALAAGGAIAGAAGNAATSQNPVQTSGSLGGSPGWLGVRYPYLIYQTANIATAQSRGYTKRLKKNSYYKYIGAKSEQCLSLKSLKDTGYNEVEAIQLHINGATEKELDEIDEILKKGVIL